MRRYRVVSSVFDSRPWILAEPIQESWEVPVRQSWSENKRQIREGLVAEFGAWEAEAKIRNFVDFGRIPFSVVAYHNVFLRQIQSSFVVGGYYPALVAACALGERILNHLLLVLRDDFKKSPHYKRVYRKSSFDDWNISIETLEAWNVLLSEPATAFRELHRIRQQSIHFRKEIDFETRKIALEAAKALLVVVEKQFGAAGPLPWFIAETKGEVYIKKEAQLLPFVRHIYLPNCQFVGPKHALSRTDGQWVVVDPAEQYDAREITDEEFVRLREAYRSK